MNLNYRLNVGPNGALYAPENSSSYSGNSSLKTLVRKNTQTANISPLTAPMTLMAYPFTSFGWLDVPLYSQSFGALPTGFGVATKDGTIQVNTEALEGLIDCGIYP